jgi:large subunit ribosomal protein L5e
VQVRFASSSTLAELNGSLSAYATGLLTARRALTKLKLADKYEGVTDPDGTLSITEVIDGDDAPRPFKAYLDVGLKRTTTGSRVFGALKGASDGGIFIPHSEKRFPGYNPEKKELKAEVLKKYIFGGHVAEYMESLEEEDDERCGPFLRLRIAFSDMNHRFKKQFSSYLEDGVSSGDIVDIYKNAHQAIREDPSFKPTEKSKDWRAESLKYKTPRRTSAQRKEAIEAKIQKFKTGADAATED